MDQCIVFEDLRFRDCFLQYYFLQEECEDDTTSVSVVEKVLASLTWSLEDVLTNVPNSPAPPSQSREGTHVQLHLKRCVDERLQATCLLSIRQFPVDGTRQLQLFVGTLAWFLRLRFLVNCRARLFQDRQRQLKNVRVAWHSQKNFAHCMPSTGPIDSGWIGLFLDVCAC